MSELLKALAFVFRRKASTTLSAMDFKHCVSLDLRWFAPADAKRLLEHAVRLRLVEADGDSVRAAFDPQAVEVPVTFRPTLAVLEEEAPADVPAPAGPREAPEPAEGAPAEEAPTGPAPLMEAADLTGAPLEDLIREAEEERKRRGRLLTPQVAAIVVARRRGVDAREHVRQAYEGLRHA